MDSRWSDIDARRAVDHYAGQGCGPDVALRVYTTRLLGADPKLVLHGGGNTSVKTVAADLLGDEVEVLCVKGSGWDMAEIEPPGLPAVRLDPLRRLRRLDALSDEDMVDFERQNLLDSRAPTPSVEALLHAFLPHKFVDHTHSTAVLSLTNQPNGEALCRDLLGDRVGIVPYVMPGFGLAKSAAQVYESNTEVRGLVLLKHGLFTFSRTAREAYEEMIGIVSCVERRLARGRKRVFASAPMPSKTMPAAEVAPILRGACAIADDSAYDGRRRFVVDYRSSSDIMVYVNGRELERYSQSGVATPDHTIRTKSWPMLLPAPAAGEAESFRTAVADAVAAFVAKYRDYFRRNAKRHPDAKTELDPMPRVVLVPGVGLFGLGRTAGEARVAADIAESTVETVTDAEAIGRFESAGEADLFDVEYWSLEQAKLGRDGGYAGRLRRVGHGRRRGHRRGDVPRVRARRRGRRGARHERGGGQRGGRGHRRGRRGHPLRRYRPGLGARRLRPHLRGVRRRRHRRLERRRGLAGEDRGRGRPRASGELRAQLLRPPDRRSERGADHEGPRNGRRAAFQRLQAGCEPRPRFRTLRPAKGSDVCPGAPVRARPRL